MPSSTPQSILNHQRSLSFTNKDQNKSNNMPLSQGFIYNTGNDACLQSGLDPLILSSQKIKVFLGAHSPSHSYSPSHLHSHNCNYGVDLDHGCKNEKGIRTVANKTKDEVETDEESKNIHNYSKRDLDETKTKINSNDVNMEKNPDLETSKVSSEREGNEVGLEASSFETAGKEGKEKDGQVGQVPYSFEVSIGVTAILQYITKKILIEAVSYAQEILYLEEEGKKSQNNQPPHQRGSNKEGTHSSSSAPQNSREGKVGKGQRTHNDLNVKSVNMNEYASASTAAILDLRSGNGTKDIGKEKDRMAKKRIRITNTHIQHAIRKNKSLRSIFFPLSKKSNEKKKEIEDSEIISLTPTVLKQMKNSKCAEILNYFLDTSTKSSLSPDLLSIGKEYQQESQEQEETKGKQKRKEKEEAKEKEIGRGKGKLQDIYKIRRNHASSNLLSNADWLKRTDDVATEAELSQLLKSIHPVYQLCHDGAMLLIALIREQLLGISYLLVNSPTEYPRFSPRCNPRPRSQNNRKNNQQTTTAPAAIPMKKKESSASQRIQTQNQYKKEKEEGTCNIIYIGSAWKVLSQSQVYPQEILFSILNYLWKNYNLLAIEIFDYMELARPSAGHKKPLLSSLETNSNNYDSSNNKSNNSDNNNHQNDTYKIIIKKQVGVFTVKEKTLLLSSNINNNNNINNYTNLNYNNNKNDNNSGGGHDIITKVCTKLRVEKKDVQLILKGKPITESTRGDCLDLEDGAIIYVLSKTFYQYMQREEARRGMLTSQRSKKDELKEMHKSAKSKLNLFATKANSSTSGSATVSNSNSNFVSTPSKNPSNTGVNKVSRRSILSEKKNRVNTRDKDKGDKQDTNFGDLGDQNNNDYHNNYNSTERKNSPSLLTLSGVGGKEKGQDTAKGKGNKANLMKPYEEEFLSSKDKDEEENSAPIINCRGFVDGDVVEEEMKLIMDKVLALRKERAQRRKQRSSQQVYHNNNFNNDSNYKNNHHTATSSVALDQQAPQLALFPVDYTTKKYISPANNNRKLSPIEKKKGRKSRIPIKEIQHSCRTLPQAEARAEGKAEEVETKTLALIDLNHTVQNSKNSTKALHLDNFDVEHEKNTLRDTNSNTDKNQSYNQVKKIKNVNHLTNLKLDPSFSSISVLVNSKDKNQNSNKKYDNNTNNNATLTTAITTAATATTTADNNNNNNNDDDDNIKGNFVNDNNNIKDNDNDNRTLLKHWDDLIKAVKGMKILMGNSPTIGVTNGIAKDIDKDTTIDINTDQQKFNQRVLAEGPLLEETLYSLRQLLGRGIEDVDISESKGKDREGKRVRDKVTKSRIPNLPNAKWKKNINVASIKDNTIINTPESLHPLPHPLPFSLSTTTTTPGTTNVNQNTNINANSTANTYKNINIVNDNIGKKPPEINAINNNIGKKSPYASLSFGAKLRTPFQISKISKLNFRRKDQKRTLLTPLSTPVMHNNQDDA